MSMTIGESFDVTDAATGDVLYSVSVVGVTVDVPCTTGETAAENGHLVGLQVQVSTMSEGTAFDATDFVVVAPDGIATDPATAAGSACLTPSETLPTGPLAAGEYSGTVVLDVTSPTGSIVHRPDPLQAGAVWVY
jgi:hypothetical protein